MTEKQTIDGRRWHDMGGVQGGGEIDRDQHDFALWEKRVDAIRQMASNGGYFSVDGLRRALEDMGPEAFETMTYYERWMEAVTRNLLASGVFTIAELNARMDRVAARGDDYGAASLERGS